MGLSLMKNGYNLNDLALRTSALPENSGEVL